MTLKKYTKEEALNAAKMWQIAWYSVERKSEEHCILHIDFCCHSRLLDGKFFQAEVSLNKIPEDLEFIRIFAGAAKNGWNEILDEMLNKSVVEFDE